MRRSRAGRGLARRAEPAGHAPEGSRHRPERAVWVRYVLALASAAVATTLDDLLGTRFPLGPILLAVLASAWLGGVGPALLTAAAGGLALVLLPPSRPVWETGAPGAADLALYLAVAVGIAGIGGLMRSARREAEVKARDAARGRAELEETVRNLGDARSRVDDVQALLAAVVESSDDAIVTKTLDGVITSWNAGAERLFGWSREEAVGSPITLVIPPERHDEEREILARLRRGERVEPFETERVTRSGARITISLSVSPIRGAGNRIVGASKVARDVTASKRAERALRESEERFRQLATNAPAAIFVKDLEGRYTLANPLAGEALGSPDTVVGLSDHDLLPAEIADALRAGDREVIATGRAVESEELVGMAPPLRRYLSVKFPLLDSADAVVGVCGVAIDITDREQAAEALRESEERFRTLADHIAQFAWMADGEGSIFWYNRRWFEYTGTTLEEMKGWGWKAVHHPDHLDRVVEKIGHCFRSGETWEDTFPLRGADGRYRWFLSRAIPIRDDQGRVTRWFGTNTDVTEQRQAEEALKEIDRRKDAFVATLAHELRNPLAAIRHALAVLLLPDAEPERRGRALAIVDRQVGHLDRLVDDLLDLSRISRDRLGLRRELLPLASVVRDALETSRPLAERAGLELAVDLPDEPLRVYGDPMRLTQVFSNLLNNACKYTGNGGRVELRARLEGEEAVVRVRDDGEGIPPEMLSRVFDMFTQVDPASDHARSGLGIGLSLVRRLVEMHGGRVEARSEGLGHGSEFEVRLPRAAEETAPERRPEISRPDGPLRRVLVVDDNVDAAESLAMLLERWGHTVELAQDGEEALKRTEAFRPDVVLLDIGLPRLSGHEVARRLRAEPWGREPVLVAVTGWGEERDRQRSRDTGFDHHLVKPVDLERLKEILAAPGRPERGA